MSSNVNNVYIQSHFSTMVIVYVIVLELLYDLYVIYLCKIRNRICMYISTLTHKYECLVVVKLQYYASTIQISIL